MVIEFTLTHPVTERVIARYSESSSGSPEVTLVDEQTSLESLSLDVYDGDEKLRAESVDEQGDAGGGSLPSESWSPNKQFMRYDQRSTLRMIPSGR